MWGATRGAWDALCAAVLSPPCAVCGRILDEPLAGAVCAGCWAAIRYLTPPLCERCGYPQSSSREAGGQPRSAPCPGCAELRVVDAARALGAYDGVLRDILHALKYSGRRSAAPRLARLLRDRHGELLEGAHAVVPVPLHPWRAWARGFNQAALLSVHLGPPVLHALRRTRHTARQAGLGVLAREHNLRGAFARSWRTSLRPSIVRGACLVLVDDVSTTGATLDACARVLKACGAREVRALTVARTLKGGQAAR